MIKESVVYTNAHPYTDIEVKYSGGILFILLCDHELSFC